MSIRLPEEKLEEIRERADIVEVVGERVSLKKAGVRHVGLCPFHQEKTPSFSVHPGLGIFHCFGCGEGGDVFAFLMKLEGRSFLDVVRDLADRAGVVLPTRALSPKEEEAERRAKSERSEMLRANEAVTAFYHDLLMSDPSARHARDYLESRGITPETVRRFKLGFAPSAWDVSVGFFRRHKADLATIARLGLVQERRGGGYYDRFRNRLLFPIHGPAGEVLGFGGRQLDDGDGPKYLNSPESPVFHKGRCLYGLGDASRAARGGSPVLVVEGYFDVIALVQSGVENVVATLGTSLTEDHVRLLRRYSRELLLMFDGDDAGVRATIRSAELILRGGVSARVVELPRGDDPDSFVLREGVDAFRERLGAAAPIIDFSIRAVAARVGDDPAAKARAVEQLRPLFESVTSQVERALYVARIAERLDIPEDAVRAVVRGVAPAAVAAREAVRTGSDARSIIGRPEERLVGLVLAHPEQASVAAEEGEVIADPVLRELVSKAAAVYAAQERIDATSLLTPLEDEALRRRLLRLAFDDDATADVAARSVRDVLDTLRERRLRREAKALQAQLSEAAQRGDQALVAKLATERLNLEKKIRGLQGSSQ